MARTSSIQELVESRGRFKKQWAAALEYYGRERDVRGGRRAHARIVEAGESDDIFLANKLIQMYGRCGHASEARAVFDSIHTPDAHSWTMMVVAYAQERRLSEARAMLDGLASAPPLVCCNAMVWAYAQWGQMRDARHFFRQMSERDAASWNALISGYGRAGQGGAAIAVLAEMDLDGGCRPNEVTLLAALDACSSVEQGRCVHREYCGASSSFAAMPVGNAVVSMYGRLGAIQEAQASFDSMGHNRNLVSWNALIKAHTIAAGSSGEAMRAFRAMIQDGTKPNAVTLLSALGGGGGGSVRQLADCRQLEAAAIESGLAGAPGVGNAIVAMYATCGGGGDEAAAFARILDRDAMSFNAMIQASGQAGRPAAALFLFRSMLVDGVAPSAATLTAVLGTCNHGGMANEAVGLFAALAGGDYGGDAAAPSLEHYVCMLDLLGRSGRLDMAKQLVDVMPFHPDTITWAALLAACREQGDAAGAARAALMIFAVDEPLTSEEKNIPDSNF